MSKLPEAGFSSFEAFYPYYLSEHRGKACKVLHFCGTLLLLFILGWIVVNGEWSKVWLVPLAGYSFAWVGHFVFEKNRPATFKYPFYSLAGDFVMFFHLLTGRLLFATGAALRSGTS